MTDTALVKNPLSSALEYLERIGASGEGGTAAYEIALDEVKEAARAIEVLETENARLTIKESNACKRVADLTDENAKLTSLVASKHIRELACIKEDADRRVAEEREACARIAETCAGDFERDTAGRTEGQTRQGIASAIRSRSNATSENGPVAQLVEPPRVPRQSIAEASDDYLFDRYVDGKLMAEGGCITDAGSVAEAAAKVARMFRNCPGSVLVLVGAPNNIGDAAAVERLSQPSPAPVQTGVVGVPEGASRLARDLLTLAAWHSTQTQFGWTHPDCVALQEAARILKGEPAPTLDDGRAIGVLSASPQPPSLTGVGGGMVHADGTSAEAPEKFTQPE